MPCGCRAFPSKKRRFSTEILSNLFAAAPFGLWIWICESGYSRFLSRRSRVAETIMRLRKRMQHGSDPFLLTLLVIFVWAKLFGELFERLALPAVLGEILAGAVMGPFAFGVVIPTPSVNSMAELGAIFLLFAVGL